MRLLADTIRALGFVVLCCLLLQVTVYGQSARERRSSGDVSTARAMEIRLQKAEEMLVNEYKEVAIEFYRQGDKERARKMLRRLQTLNPELEGLQERIDSISEELMLRNGSEYQLDTSTEGWQQVADVAKGKAFRISAEGDFQLVMTATVGVTGMSADKESAAQLPDAALGCLLGIVVGRDGKPGKPFIVGGGLDVTPQRDGQLHLKVNVPPRTKCSGKLRIQLSGHVRAPQTTAQRNPRRTSSSRP